MLRRLTRCSSLCGESKLKAFCFQWRVPAAPREAGALRGGADAPSSALLPMGGPTRPTPGVPFVSRRKEPKACRGCAPRPPEGDRAKSVSLFAPAPPAASRNPLDRAFSHNKRPICHFGFMGKSVLFFPLVSSREHFLFSIRGSAGGLPPRIPQILYSRNQYR